MKLKTLLSLKSLIILGFVIAVIPLFLAVMWAALDMREASALGKSVNSQVFEQTKKVRKVLQKASDIERKARLFVLLAEPGAVESYERQSYETVRASFKQALADLIKLNAEPKLSLLVNELGEKENLIYQQVIDADRSNDVDLPVDAAFQDLHESSLRLSREFESHVDHQFAELAQMSDAIEEGLLIKGGVLFAVSFVVVVLLVIVISPSLRQLDVAIRRLGSGHLAHPVEVKGPSDLRYLGNRLEWLRTRLIELENSKQQFIQNVIREIDGPLQSIRDNSQELVERDLEIPEDTAPELSENLNANIDKLNAVTHELLRYSQISAQAENQDKQLTDMAKLLDEVIAGFAARLEQKGLTIKKLARPVQINGIAEQLQTVLQQLLDNAVTYSPTGGEIRILLREAGMQMELEVEDEGPGIAEDERDHVFEPFFRGRPAQAEQASNGAGLGLTIVKEYVANHQGKVEIIEARQDQPGARIRVQIPITESI